MIFVFFCQLSLPFLPDFRVVSSMKEVVPQLNVDNMENSSIESMLQCLNSLTDIEDRVRECLKFMQQVLSNDLRIDIRVFWGLKKYCLPLFKDLSGLARNCFWKTYIDLNTEARKLKAFMDEETAFVCEQIEIAVAHLEKDVGEFFNSHNDFCDSRDKFVLAIVNEISSLKDKERLYYSDIYVDLSWLNIFVSRLVNLRKELIKTDMRIKLRNRFFQRLSVVGDLIFPKRRDLITAVSESFKSDIIRFAEDHFNTGFSRDKIKKNLFVLKNEIRLLQNLAKELTLNTSCFSEVRGSLSQCWDKLREFEKEIKQERIGERQASGENTRLVEERLGIIRENFLSSALSLNDCRTELGNVSKWMRKLDLVHSDVVSLREKLRNCYSLIEEAELSEEKLRQEKDREKEALRAEKQCEFDAEVQKVQMMLSGGVDCSEIKSVLEALTVRLVKIECFSKSERGAREKLLNNLKNNVSENEEKILLSLSSEDEVAFAKLKEALVLKKDRRKELKEQLEKYKKLSGSSGCNFEKAMYYDQLIYEEKEKLNALNQSISDLEKHISDLRK